MVRTKLRYVNCIFRFYVLLVNDPNFIKGDNGKFLMIMLTEPLMVLFFTELLALMVNLIVNNAVAKLSITVLTD